MEKDGGNVSKELEWLMLLRGSYANVCVGPAVCCVDDLMIAWASKRPPGELEPMAARSLNIDYTSLNCVTDG